jgi:hypothetical protein
MLKNQFLYRQALADLATRKEPVIVFNGHQLVDYRRDRLVLPDLIFRDINMLLKKWPGRTVGDQGNAVTGTLDRSDAVYHQ